ncbi:Protease HtpX [Buchnera aphidicola (Cinara strobi)]|uniref:Protease HtpX n=2 Tax=Buchnera aphidicola TaxID=9 RepID=A0A3B1DWA8_9GAMM|nr:Protease HtpX [Buchnera aphidicola (Cinara strobi)]
MMRIILFLITNISMFVVIGGGLSITGVSLNNIYKIIFSSILFSILGSIISLFLSKYVTLRSLNGRVIYLPKNNMEKWLLKIVKKQSELSGIKNLEIGIYESQSVNAFATGFKKNNSLISISSGLLKKMNRGEIEAVIAHEISHITSGDMVTMILIRGISNIYINILMNFFSRYFLKFLPIFKKKKYRNCSCSKICSICLDRQSFLFSLATSITKFTISIFSTMIIMWFSRRREFHADAGSVKLVGSKKMIAALTRLKEHYMYDESIFINNLGINGNSNLLFYYLSSHPSIDDRIKAIQEQRYL